MNAHQVDLNETSVMPSPKMRQMAVIFLVVGVVLLAVGAFMGFGGSVGSERFYFSYLIAFCFYMSLTLGAFFFTFVQHLVSAGWSVVIRRFAENVSSNILLMAVLFIPLLVGRNEIWHWLSADHVAHDPLLIHKEGYLNQTFFFIRCAAYFVLWIVLIQYFVGTSLKQDVTGDWRSTVQMKKVSAPTAYIFAISITLFSIDMLMSLDPHWFSTMFGVYYFAGSALACFALLPVLVYMTQRSGRLTEVITEEHYHDMGKFMFAFSVFWAYIAFSQFMLIWYANIPEETEWYLKRTTGQWETLSWFLLLGRFVIPFVILISRFPKRRPQLLVPASAWMLFMHWFDLYWIAMPEYPHPTEGTYGQAGMVPFSIVDILCWLGMGGVFAGVGMLRSQNRALIPTGDPRLSESAAFEQGGG